MFGECKILGRTHTQKRSQRRLFSSLLNDLMVIRLIYHLNPKSCVRGRLFTRFLVFLILTAFFISPIISYADDKVLAMGSIANPQPNTQYPAPKTQYPKPNTQCFYTAAKAYRLPVDILKAIAKTESNFNPYALNINGRSYSPKSLETALKLLMQHENDNPDIGIMQVNARWFKRLGYPLYYGLNPCFNIYMGAYVLRKKIDKYGFNWKGIAAYHSATPKRNRRYAWLVYKNLQSWR